MTLPNFLFIGPDKTGSSWIFEYLKSHPDCFLPVAKDIYFFDNEYRRGLGWYETFFAESKLEHKAIGEICHDYILSDAAADAISESLSNVKLVCSVRNPRERSISHYQYLKRSGLVSGSFTDMIKQRPDLIENSRYSVMLKRYWSRFEKSDLLVLFFDDLRAKPDAFAQQVTEFLGISTKSAEHIGVVRPASRARSSLVAKQVKRCAELARALGLQNLVGRLKHSRAAQLLYVPIDKAIEDALSDNELQMLDDLFEPEIVWLEKHFNRDLTHWRDR